MSKNLDPKAYEREVVAPLRKARGVIPDDLLSRYAVDLSMTARELGQRVDEIVALWNARADGPGLVAVVYRAFAQAHEDLGHDKNVRFDDPQWWQERARQRATGSRREMSELAEEAEQAYGPVGFILPSQLADLGKRYRGLRETELRQAIEQAGIGIITPTELPQRSGLDPLMYDKLLGKMAEAGAPTIAHLLYPGLVAICLYRDPDQSAARPLTRFDRDALERRVKASETEANSARSRAVTAVLGILRTAAAHDTDLRQLAVFQILEKARETRAAGQPALLTLRSLQELGLTEWDARVLTASLLAAEGARAASGGPEDVRRLVGAGQLGEARRFLAGLPAADPETTAVRELVAKAEAEVAELLSAAKLALDCGDEAEAARKASAARSLAADDPTVTGFADSLPPPPPLGLVVVADGLDVKLSWQAPLRSGAALRYRVVRCEGRAPIEPNDGAVIADGPTTTARDAAAPAARSLRYGVFATTDGMKWSRAATCETQILPPVVDVDLRLAKGNARCGWRTHPDAARVVVAHRPGTPPTGPRDGRLVETAGSRFADADLESNVTHCYAITAVYRGADGGELLAGTVVVTAAAEEERKPVASLRAEPVGGDELRARISWRQRNADDVQIRRARTACPWAFGARVPRHEVQTYGDEVTGELSVTNGRAALVATMPSGHMFLTAFSFAGDYALVGQDVDVGFTAPVGPISHERRGGEVLLSWPWPTRASAAQVQWSGDAGTGKRRITRGERARDDGWAKIPADSGPMRVEIRAVEVCPTGNAISSPQVVRIAVAQRTVSYAITWKPVLPGATRRACDVRLTAPAGCAGVTVVATAKPGVARPSQADDGQEVARWHGDVPGDGAALFPVAVPRSFRKPYWLCCFIADGSDVLVDPPISQMKVG